jgi:hypothetical protein
MEFGIALGKRRRVGDDPFATREIIGKLGDVLRFFSREAIEVCPQQPRYLMLPGMLPRRGRAHQLPVSIPV